MPRGLQLWSLLMTSVLMGTGLRAPAVTAPQQVPASEQARHGAPGADAESHQLEQVRDWLARAEVAVERGRLIEPPEHNAAYWYRRVLQVQPANVDAASGIDRVRDLLIERAYAAADADFDLAFEWLLAAEELGGEQVAVERARTNIMASREREAQRIERQILAMIQAGEFGRAEFALLDLVALGAGPERVAGLRERIEGARRFGEHEAGDILQTPLRGLGVTAPAVVVIAPGSFLMGSPEDEAGRTDNEDPRHRVTFSRGFALGTHEVTVGEFRAFVTATGHRTRAEADDRSLVYSERTGRLSDREGVNWRHDYAGRRAREDHPVLHVSWNDAWAYVTWLAKQTGKPFRLPSEAEFEYALRAGSVTRFWWGEGTPGQAVENLAAEYDSSPGDRRWSAAFEGYRDGYWGPAPVGSFEANALGLYDMAGNVSEWVMDCWHASYVRAPLDGSAWTNPGCARRVVRGGYWAGGPRHARSAARLSADADLHGPRVGFRVARDLEP